jgi:hypothetical protein
MLIPSELRQAILKDKKIPFSRWKPIDEHQERLLNNLYHKHDKTVIDWCLLFLECKRVLETVDHDDVQRYVAYFTWSTDLYLLVQQYFNAEYATHVYYNRIVKLITPVFDELQHFVALTQHVTQAFGGEAEPVGGLVGFGR